MDESKKHELQNIQWEIVTTFLDSKNLETNIIIAKNSRDNIFTILIFLYTNIKETNSNLRSKHVSGFAKVGLLVKGTRDHFPVHTHTHTSTRYTVCPVTSVPTSTARVHGDSDVTTDRQTDRR